MENQKLRSYITEQLHAGTPEKKIREDLMTHGGWHASDLDNIFKTIPTSTATSAPTPIQTEPPSPQPTSRKPLFTILFITLAICVVGGSAFAYFTYFNQKSPEKVLSLMAENISNMKTVEHEGTIQVKFSSPNSFLSGSVASTPDASLTQPETFTFSVQFSGQNDFSDIEKTLGYSKVRIQTDSLSEFTDGSTDPIEFEFRNKNNVMYIRINELPETDFFDLSFLTNQWVAFDFASLSEQFDMKEFEEEMAAAQQESRQNFEEWRNKILQANIFTITDVLPQEKIEGELSYQYKFAIDTEALLELLIEFGSDIDTVTEEDIESYKESIDDLGSIVGKIWISKKDYLPRKLVLSANSVAQNEYDANVTIGVLMLLRNYNEPVIVETPSPVKNIEEILEEFFDSMFSDLTFPSEVDISEQKLSPDALTRAQNMGSNATIKSRLANLRADAELYYDDNEFSYEGFCESTEARRLLDMPVLYTNSTTYICNDTKTEWAASKPLLTDEYWCVDSTGTAQSILNDIGTKVSCR